MCTLNGLEIRPVPSCPGYFAREDGTIWSSKSGSLKIIKNRIVNRKRKSGTADFIPYATVALWVDGKAVTKSVHSLVLESFVGPRPDGMQCRHLDGNPQNNSPKNLVWGTCKENTQDRALHGRVPRGESKCTAKLTEDDVCEVKRMLNADIPFKAIMKKYNVCHGTVQSIREWKTWVGVGPEITKPKGDRCGERSTSCRLTESDVREIRRLRKHCGMSQCKLAEQFGVNSGTIYCIISGRTWKHVS